MNANQQQNTANTQQPQQDNQQANGYDPNNPYMNMPDQEWRKTLGMVFHLAKSKLCMQLKIINMKLKTQSKNLQH